MSTPDDQDHYAVLGVPEDADTETIVEAYRRRAQRYHPDKVSHLAEEFQELAERRMRELNRAVEVLRDPKRRAAYDAARRRSKTAEPDVEAESPHATSTRNFWFLIVGILLVGGILAGGLYWAGRRTKQRPPTTFEVLRRGVAYLESGHVEAALILAEKVTEDRPRLVAGWDLRWRAERALGRDRDAAESLLAAIRLAPTNVEYRAEHAALRFRLGETEAARAELVWLERNGQTALVVRLMERFRAIDPERARRLEQIDRR